MQFLLLFHDQKRRRIFFDIMDFFNAQLDYTLFHLSQMKHSIFTFTEKTYLPQNNQGNVRCIEEIKYAYE